MASRASATRATPEQRLGFLLVDAVRLLRRDFYQRTAGMNLTPALARLLFYVFREPGSRQADLAARLEVTPVTLGRMVDRLVERRYVRRVADSGDRRALRVFVDRAGEPLVVTMAAVSSLTAARATRGLTKREQGALLRHLDRICDNLSNRKM
jgi:MarR family transcriptional regulator, transcriptional regulator for hemolysin